MAKAARASIDEAAYVLAGEIWEGKWDHVAEVKTIPVGKWTVMPVELARRCPGHTEAACQRALSRAMFLP